MSDMSKWFFEFFKFTGQSKNDLSESLFLAFHKNASWPTVNAILAEFPHSTNIKMLCKKYVLLAYRKNK